MRLLCILILMVIMAYIFTSCDIIFSSGTGDIDISTDPPGASIYLDGEWSGHESPAVLEGVAEGQHELQLSDHYSHQWKKQVNVKRDETVYIQVQQATRLQVISDPPGAIIILSDSLTDYVTPHVFDELPLELWYSVRILHEDFLPEEFRWRRQYGDDRVIDVDMHHTPDFTITYTLSPYYDSYDFSIYSVQMDGLNNQVQFENIQDAKDVIHWSPSGEYFVYRGTGGTTVATRDGTVITTIPFYSKNPRDFTWSHNSQLIAWGSYYDGIYLYNVAFNHASRVYYTGSGVYSHCPAFSPDDQRLVMIVHSWGVRGRINWQEIGGSWHNATDRLDTNWDENVDLAWISDSTVIFHADDAGLFYLPLSYSTREPELLIAEPVSDISVTQDQQLYAINIGTEGIFYGTVGNWSPSRLTDSLVVNEMCWTPYHDGIVFRSIEGIYYVTLAGNIFHILPSTDVAGISVMP